MRRSWRILLPAAILVLLVLLGMNLAQREAGYAHQLRLATTTSVKDTGVMDSLIERFDRWTQKIVGVSIEVRYVGVGTGAALTMAERGDIDAVIVHAPVLEKAKVSEGVLVCRSPIAYNFFVLVGPRDDPAKTRDLDLSQGFRNIFIHATKRSTLFVSRGDDSGTHVKEKGLWEATGINYARLAANYSGSWYLESGKGMGDTLLVAEQKEAYTLTDIGTWLALRNRLPSLEVMIDRSVDGINVYSMLLVNPERFPKANADDARLFEQYATGEEGQALIGSYGSSQYGTPLFYSYTSLKDASKDQVAKWIHDNAVFESPCPKT